MVYDICITGAVAACIGEAAAQWPTDAIVEIAVDDRMTVVVFKREANDEGLKVAWDTDGSGASAEYLALAPLDQTGDRRETESDRLLRECLRLFSSRRAQQFDDMTELAGKISTRLARLEDQEPDPDKPSRYEDEPPEPHPDDYRGPDGVLGNDFDGPVAKGW